MTDSRVKLDLTIQQMASFNEEFIVATGETPAPLEIKTGKMTMTVRNRTSQEVLALFDSTTAADPVYVAGKPLVGTIALDDTIVGKFTLAMDESHTAHLCPDGRSLVGAYDIVYTTAAGVASVLMYGEVNMVPSPSRPNAATP